MTRRRLRVRHMTSIEVARAGGVSRVFSPGVSVKVREAAVRLGYRPNALARSPISKICSIRGCRNRFRAGCGAQVTKT